MSSTELLPPVARGDRISPFLQLIVCIAVATGLAGGSACADDAIDDRSAALAQQVIIHRDRWGVAHVCGETDESTIFGMGYVQAEDFYWQLEDTTIQAIGRYAEIMGEDGLKTDLLTRSFEIPRRSREDFRRLGAEYQSLGRAFAGGVNYFLQTHPDFKPRLLEKYEPWFVLAIDRYLMLSMAYGGSGAGKPRPSEARISAREPSRPVNSWQWGLVHGQQTATGPASAFEHDAREAIGSNAWAIAPSKTQSGAAMLFINPHQPWYGIGQFYEVHLHSDETIRFSGACFFGTPIPTLGHNEHLGWTYTVNKPDVADSWRVTFDDPSDPLNYRFDGGHRRAQQWTEAIGIRSGGEVRQQQVTFRKTHHGPIMRQNGGSHIAARVGRLFDLNRVDQAFSMVRAQNFDQWREAFSHCAIPMFNVAYADCEGNIFYGYNGAVPIRDEQYNWSKTVDGSDPGATWNGFHTIDQLPQVLNPASGYIQNCNSSPFVTTDAGNPRRDDFPEYMVREKDEDKRRAKRSRQMLRQAKAVSFEQFQQMAFDTTLYWATAELPHWQRQFALLERSHPQHARRIQPYLDHLIRWDGRADQSSTAAALCISWYEELYGTSQSETIKSQYRDDPAGQLMALEKVAGRLERLHGDWKTPWGKVHRLQRASDCADTLAAGVSLLPIGESLPCAGAPGPLGVIFTVYSTPSVPLVRPQRFAVVGCSYMAVVEFGPQIRTASVVPFGASGDVRSPHFRDQSALLSQNKFKQAWFYPDDVANAAKRSYRPGANPNPSTP